MALLAASGCAVPAATEGKAEKEEARLFAAETARQVGRCYRAPRVASIGREIITQIRARYGPDGALLGMPLVIAQNGVTPMNRSYASSMAEAARLATKVSNKRRLALVLETSALNYFLKGEMASAIKDAKESLKVSDQFADMKDFQDAHLTLAGAYESSQDFAKAADHLKKYISVAELGPEDRTRKQEKLTYLTNKARANGQIK